MVEAAATIPKMCGVVGTRFEKTSRAHNLVVDKRHGGPSRAVIQLDRLLEHCPPAHSLTGFLGTGAGARPMALRRRLLAATVFCRRSRAHLLGWCDHTATRETRVTDAGDRTDD